MPEELEAVLRAALRDPGLRVGYRAPGATAYVDVGGSEITGPGEVTRIGAEQTCLIVSSGPAAPQLLHEERDQSGAVQVSHIGWNLARRNDFPIRESRARRRTAGHCAGPGPTSIASSRRVAEAAKFRS